MTRPAGDVDLLYSDVEDSLRESVRDLLTARCPAQSVIATYDGDRSLVAPLWRSLAAELGLAGLLVPEDLGGAGASAREAAVVLEELGRFAAPVPFLTSSVVATAVLLAAGTDEAGALLAGLASGERTAALAVPFSTGPFSTGPFSTGPGSLMPTVKRSGDVLDGRVRSVAGALEADVLLVPVAVDGGVEVHLVEAAALSVEPVVSLDMTRQVADVS